VDISISDVTRFLRCRRQWEMQSPLRMNLVKIGMPSASLYIGSGVHIALAANAQGKDWREELDAWFTHEVHQYVKNYMEVVGLCPSDSEVKPMHDAMETIDGIVRRYFDRYGESEPFGKGYTPVLVEKTFRVPIPDTLDGHFVGTIDALVKDPSGQFFIVDHKTYAKAPNLDELALTPQFTAYSWAMTAVLGAPISGILYNGMRNKVPTAPALLQKGGLSQAWSDSIDYPTYLDALDGYGLDPTPYEGFLARLKERDSQDETPFWSRWKIYLTSSQIATFASYLPAIYRDMTGDPAIYPNFSWSSCLGCAVKDLCKATEHGDDVSWLIDQEYTQGSGSQSHRNRHGMEVAVDAAAFA
jgi:hypothetical protein